MSTKVIDTEIAFNRITNMLNGVQSDDPCKPSATPIQLGLKMARMINRDAREILVLSDVGVLWAVLACVANNNSGLDGARVTFLCHTENVALHAFNTNTDYFMMSHGDVLDGKFDDMAEVMKFDVVIGNPPYQKLDQDGDSDHVNKKSALPIYQYFHAKAEQWGAKQIVMVVPSKCISGGRGLDGFRRDVLLSGRVKNIVLRDKSEWFKTKTGSNGPLEGHIVYHWDREHNGVCEFTTETGSLLNPDLSVRTVDLSVYDIALKTPDDGPVLNKVIAAAQGGLGFIAPLGCGPYGLSTNFFTSDQYKGVQVRNEHNEETLMCAWNDQKSKKKRNGPAFRPVLRSVIARNQNTIDKWKVITAVVSGRDGGTSTTFVIGPQTVCTATYLVLGTFDTEYEAVTFSSLFTTVFFQWCISTRMIAPVIIRALKWVPALDWSRSWTEDEVHQYFGLTSDDVEYINNKMTKVMRRLSKHKV